MHHIKPVSEYPELKYDVNNIILVCDSCHKILHKHRTDLNNEIILYKVSKVFNEKLSNILKTKENIASDCNIIYL